MVLTEHMPGLFFRIVINTWSWQGVHGEQGDLNVLRTLPLFLWPNMQRTYTSEVTHRARPFVKHDDDKRT
jgi:hypothetical protein